MQDIYYRSPEEQKANLESQIKRFCPALIFHQLHWVDKPTHFVIDDISPHFPYLSVEEKTKRLENFTHNRLQFLSLFTLCESLTLIGSPLLQQIDPEIALVVFPGAGANTVKLILDHQGLFNRFRAILIGASRIKNSETGLTESIFLSEIRTKPKETKVIKTVIVIDDVIDTAATIKAVKRELSCHNATWYAATPILLSPFFYEGRNNFPSSVEAYQGILASLVIGAKEPPPINSLSSFLEQGQKAERLIERSLTYVSSNEDRIYLLETLSDLRNMVRY